MGSSRIIKEFQFLKKFIFVIGSLLVINMIIIYTLLYYGNIFDSYSFVILIIYSFSLTMAISMGTFFRILTLLIKSDLRLYIAKGYCKMILVESNYFQKMKYLFLILISYNKYL